MLEIILAKFEVILGSETPSFIPVLVQMYFFLTESFKISNLKFFREFVALIFSNQSISPGLVPANGRIWSIVSVPAVGNTFHGG